MYWIHVLRFFFFFRRPAIFFYYYYFISAGRTFRFFCFPPAGHFISEVVPRNPGHATHFSKGNENPLGNKLGGGPGGGARTPPASIIERERSE